MTRCAALLPMDLPRGCGKRRCAIARSPAHEIGYRAATALAGNAARCHAHASMARLARARLAVALAARPRVDLGGRGCRALVALLATGPARPAAQQRGNAYRAGR